MYKNLSSWNFPSFLYCRYQDTWEGLVAFTKPPLFQRNRLTGSGIPSCVEEKAQQREIEVYSRSSFQIPHDCTFLRGTADQNWFSVVVFERSSSFTLQFSSTQLLQLGLFLWSRGGLVNETWVLPKHIFEFLNIEKFQSWSRWSTDPLAWIETPGRPGSGPAGR